MLIRNYGLFWRREWVFWGKKKRTGHMMGILASSKKGKPTNFRDQQGIYVLYDDNFRLVYVGQAGANDQQRLFDRLKQHTRDQLSDRWTKFSWFGIRPVNNTGTLRVENSAVHPPIGDVLNHIEAILISAAEPPHNRQGGRFGEKVEQYLQFRDQENLGPEAAEALMTLWKALPTKAKKMTR